MKCALLQTITGGQALVGYLQLHNGEITGEAADPSHQIAMDDCLSEEHIVNGRRSSKEKDPEGWFRALPRMYNGSYFRAMLLDDKEKSAKER